MKEKKETRPVFRLGAFVLFVILIFTLIFSLNANAVGVPTVTVILSRDRTTCVVINATYNDTVSVPSSAGCNGLSCAADLACCNPKLTDENGRSYNLSNQFINGGKTIISTRCALMPLIYDYNITAYDGDGNSRGAGATFEVVPPETLCGNRVVNSGEECDDGNHVNGDNCDQYCRREYCGNGRVDPGRNEECDGNDLSNQNCSSLGSYRCGNLACNPTTCRFDLNNCGCSPPVFCGDGIISPERGEQCEPSISLSWLRCSDINPAFTGGTLYCRNCTINTSSCIGPSSGWCGDNTTERGEQCEGTNLYSRSCSTFNFTGGSLSCNPARCLFDVSLCTITAPYCGDGMINTKEETCDGTNLGTVTDCGSLGLCGGPLSCDSNTCHFIGCEPCPNLCGPVSPGIDPGEECDGINMPRDVTCPYGGTIGCTAACQLDYGACFERPVYCGNGVLDPGEQCDTRLTPNSKLCSYINPAFTGGSVSCSQNCTYNTSSRTSSCTGNGGGSCGDSIIELGEQCEGSNLYSRSCATFNFTNGTLSCNPNTCQFNTSRCNNPPPFCGDGRKNQVTESCDGSDLGGMRCSNFSQFSEGTLGCTGDCHFDTDACIPVRPITCDNGELDPGEECDGSVPPGMACPNGGQLRCNDCKLNYSGCAPIVTHCGNRIVDPCEQCDVGPGGGSLSIACSVVNPAFTPGWGRVSCNRDCTYNTSLCYGSTGGGCGDGYVVLGEQCEDSDVNGRSCIDFGTFTTGSLTCISSSCMFNTCHCGGQPGSCGDNVWNNNNESCDGNDLNGQTCASLGFYIGELGCLPNCHFDTSQCVPFPDLCGNGDIDNNEECDGSNLNNMNCMALGYAGGALRCYASSSPNKCKFDKTSCTDPPDFCGDGRVQSGEQCEPPNAAISTAPGNVKCQNISSSFTGGTLRCNNRCMYNTTSCTGPSGGSCGDNTVVRGEQCEGTNLDGRTCNMINPYFTSGNLRCERCLFNTSDCSHPDPYCGDGVRQLSLDESCDGSDLGNLRCTNFSEYIGGTLGCNGGSCTFNFASCTPKESPLCNNGVINPGAEECDGTAMPDVSCPNGGTVRCANNCTLDFSGCDPILNFCGNGVVNPGEQCEPPNTVISSASGNVRCQNISSSFTGGTLRCDSRCMYNTTSCTGTSGGSCGDNTVARGEQCEGTNLDGRTCNMINPYFTAGSLTCVRCMFNTSRCSSPAPICGDGTKNDVGESCDGNDLGGLTCDDFPGFRGGTLRCANCNFDTSGCTLYVEPRCGDGIIQPSRGEICDGTNLNGMDCGSLGFAPGGSLSCTSINCWFNTSRCLSLPDYCGNGRVDPCEQCDGIIHGLSCQGFGFTIGVLSCTPNCTINTRGCVGNDAGYCGDNILERGEQCDRSLEGSIGCSNFSTAFISGSLSCNVSNCSTNTCECTVGTIEPRCGDGVRHTSLGEECDGTDTGGLTCLSLGFARGTLGCSNSCILDTSGCIRGTHCGDGLIQRPNSAGFNEECDATNLGGMTCVRQFGSTSSGTVTCRNDCTLEFNCINIPLPVCGDNLTNREIGEECDGTDLDGKTCVSLGYDHGNLKCNAPRTTNQCRLDKSECVGIPNYCGDRVVQPGEQCDGSIGSLVCADFGFTSGSVSCNQNNCTINTRNCVGIREGWCGDNTLEVGEQCDGSVGSGMSCQDFGFMSGSLRCVNCMINTSSCISSPPRGYCGDNIVQQPNGVGTNESCDGSNINNKICRSFDSYTGGTLACRGDCSFDFTNCIGPLPRCGDGVRHTQLGEDCDLTDLGTETCLSLGYIGGTLTCNSTCGFVKSACIPDPNRPYCGNSNIDVPNSVGFNEQCDSPNLGGKICSDFPSYSGGTLSCDGDCTFDYTNCIQIRNYCGNYLVDPCEDCDEGPNGGIVSELRCSNINSLFTPNRGTVRCTRDCKFNTSSCVGTAGGSCGDREVEVGEQCDGGVGSLSCTDISSAFNGGILSCNTTSCKFNTCRCNVGSPLPRCGDRVINQDSEECDYLDLNGRTCRSLGYSSGTLRCSDDCNLDRTSCVPFPEKRCGDNIVQQPNDAGFNESCDGTNLNGGSCLSFPAVYNGGTLRCSGDCNFDFISCTPIVPPRCGDGVRHTSLGEDCDGSQLGGSTCRSLGYDTGTLGCNSTCGFDKSNCQYPPERPVCGDGEVQKPNYAGFREDCDGSNLNGMACNNLDNFGGGTLACSGDCTFNTLDCWAIINRCGDGRVGPGEQCEGTAVGMTCTDMGFAGGTLSCRNCRYNTSSCTGATGGYCGDGNLVRGEQCDGSIGSLQCPDINSAFNGGTLRCNASCILDTNQCTIGPPQPVCGDAVRNQDSEECDGSDTGGRTCQSLGYASGTLRCYAPDTTNQCRLNTSGCVPGPQPYCGDGTIQTPNSVGFNEQCDGSSLNGRTCSSFTGYSGGTLRCHNDCTYDYGECTSVVPIRCGDSIKNQLIEDCDDTDFAGHTCISQGYSGGTLRCTGACKFDKSGCNSDPTTRCGDSRVQKPNSAGVNEDCDGSNLDGKVCSNFDGYVGGVLRCGGDCVFDYSGCSGPVPRCNDGVANQLSEDCDGTDLAGTTCVSLGYIGGDLKCTSGCKFDKTDCVSAPNYCGDRVVQPGEQCDGSVSGGLVCATFGFTSGSVSCNQNNCTVNTRNCVGVRDGYCGDGTLEVGEQCDGSVSSGVSCQDFGFMSGSLRCTRCMINTSSCVAAPLRGYCGDNTVQQLNGADFNESCDGSNINNKICRSFDSYTGGTLACHNDCTFDYSSCTGGTLICGDNVKNQASEECDGIDLSGQNCRSLGYASGTLRCYGSGTPNPCELDTSLCVPGTQPYCGDNVVQQPNSAGLNESCDGSSLNGRLCISFGYRSGTLRCHNDCTYDYDGCSKCGDGVKNPEEECDGSDYGGLTCESQGYLEGTLRCTTGCKLDKSSCISNPDSRVCGDSTVQQPNDAGFNEQCDRYNLNSMLCPNIDEYTGGTLACSGDCTFDHSRCTGGPGPVCGNNARDIGEECDSSDLGGATCWSLGYANGTLGCTVGCKLNKSRCVYNVNFCGDRFVQAGEQCDGSVGSVTCADFGFTGGSVSCNSNCTYNTRSCTGPAGGWCGDGTVAVGEQCDGSVGPVNCRNFGLIDGTLRCTYCLYNTTGCITPPRRGYCGDNAIQTPNEAGFNEQCDGTSLNNRGCTTIGLGFTSGTLACGGDCTFDHSGCSKCGDNIKNQLSEECDGADLDTQTCISLGYASGTLRCTSGCRLDKSSCVPKVPPVTASCGDGTVQKPNDADFNEQCDGSNLDGKVCSNFGDYTGGTLRCRGDCTFDYSSCSGPTPRCGDNAKNRLAEDCDGTDLAGSTCASLGFESGTLRCSSGCAFDKSSCVPFVNFCGDFRVQPGEQCDGSVGSVTCADLGFTSGSLSCQSCSYNTNNCVGPSGGYCGDNILEKGEQCEGSTVSGVTCQDFGFMSGSLRCTRCMINTSSCVPIPRNGYCGDSSVQQPNGAFTNESCDGSNLNGKRCNSFTIYGGGTLGCLGDCSFDYTSCTILPPTTSCGDRVVQQPNSAGLQEDCDGDDLNGRTCVSLGYVSGILTCTSGCKFDKNNCSNVRPTYCGDNIIQKPNSAGLNESCEGSNLNGRVCTQFDSYLSGTLACHGDCSFSYDNCNSTVPPRCGDGAKNQFTEECDGSDFGVDTCLSLGYINGSLKCTSGCKLDKTSCVPPLNFCGDRLVEPGEQCDGNLGNATCRSFGFTGGGSLSCKNCTYDTSACIGPAGGSCGDGTTVVGEQCDGSVSSSVSCTTFSLWDGTIQCTNCRYNTNRCIAPSSLGYCGDGGVQKPNWVGFNEDCDGSNLNAKKCSDAGDYNAGTLRCHGDCTFDYSNCTSTRVIASCGDGAIQVPNSAGFNEQCDGSNLDGRTCSSFSGSGYTGGALHCSGDCSFDYSGCSGPAPRCGDSVKNQLSEECDGTDLGSQSCQGLGYASGTLSCTSGCKLNKAGCVSGPSTYCGDSNIQQPNGVGFVEQCDGSSLNGRVCSSFSGYSGGTLVCHGDCSYDYSGCTSTADPRCGDSVKNRLSEDCDGSDLSGHTCRSQGYLSGTLSCTAGCKFDKSKCSSAQTNSCGDSVVQQPNGLGVMEDCDGADFNGETCISLGYTSGTLRCTSGCKLDKTGCIVLNTTTSACGDGTIQAPNKASFYEQCDGSNLNNMICSNFDSYTGGNLACYGDCSRDYRSCSGGTFRCGDGVRNNVSEECDVADLAGQSCQTFGYISGTLSCTSGCKLDKAGCVAAPSTYCGDGTIQAPNGVGFNEQCDGTNLNANKCSDFGDYTGGTLKCYTGCSHDYSKCTGAEPRCGDGAKNQAVEECDAGDFGGQTCKYLGYASGSLKCTSGCKLDKTSCVKGNGTYCGDNSVQKPNGVSFNEQCDGTNLNSKDCADFDYSDGKLLCAGDCTFTYNNCTTVTGGLCGDGVKNGQELCDKNDWGTIFGCTSFSSFKGGTLSCLSDSCHFDTSKCISVNDTTSLVNASCYDSQKDGDETDLDCGGSCFPCSDGNACIQNNDCQSNNCKNGICNAASCEDSVRNGIETDADCGGNCPQCEVGMGCSIDSDCISTFCNVEQLLCAIPACNDGFPNGDESDLDCGGGCPTRCTVGQRCRVPSDCQSGSCEAGLCSQDRNLDSDGDGIPDFWEDKYGLDKYDPGDANKDLDGDGYTNLQEYNMQSDPTDPLDPQTPGRFRNHTVQIILLIIGLLFMAGGAGFLVYSRKVLVPQQKAAAQKKGGVPPALAQRPLLGQPLSRLFRLRGPQGSQRTLSGRFVKKEGERKSLLEGFGKEKQMSSTVTAKPDDKATAKPGVKPEFKSGVKPEAGAKPRVREEAIKPKPSAEADKSDEFIDLSELGKQAGKADKSEQAQEAKAPDKKASGDVFKKLKELSASGKKK